MDTYIDNITNPNSSINQYKNKKINMLTIPYSINSAKKIDYDLLKSPLSICGCHTHHCCCIHCCSHHCHCHCHHRHSSANEILIPQQNRILYRTSPLYTTTTNIEMPKITTIQNIPRSTNYSFSFKDKKYNNNGYDNDYNIINDYNIDKTTDVVEKKKKIQRSNTCENYDNIGYHYINEVKLKDGEGDNKTCFTYGNKNFVNDPKSQNSNLNKSKSNTKISNYSKYIDKYSNKNKSHIISNPMISSKELSKSYFQPNYKKYVYGDSNSLKTSMIRNNHKYIEINGSAGERTPIRSYYSKINTNSLNNSELVKGNISYIPKTSMNKKENSIVNINEVRNDYSPSIVFSSKNDINKSNNIFYENDNVNYYGKSPNINQDKDRYNGSTDELNTDDIILIENKYYPKKQVYRINNDNSESLNYEVSNSNNDDNYEMQYNNINNGNDFNQMGQAITFNDKFDNANNYELNEYIEYLDRNHNENINTKKKDNMVNNIVNNYVDRKILKKNKDYLERYLTDKNYVKYINKMRENNKINKNNQKNISNTGNFELNKKTLLKSNKNRKKSSGNKSNNRYVNKNNGNQDKALYQLQKKFS